MASESNVRFYDINTGERVSHTPKVKHKDEGLPRFVWNADDDERYKKLSSGDIFDEATQNIVPSHATPVRVLSAERYWEALTDESGNQISFPSVTQLANILANDGVVKWQVNNTINFYNSIVLELMSGDEEATPEQVDFANEMRREALLASSPSDAAERGTRFHTALERHFLYEDWAEGLLDEEIEPCRTIIKNIDEGISKRHKKGENLELEKSFVNKESGVGGQADLRISSTVYDYKFSDKTLRGKRGGLLKANWCYPERALQLAQYADGLKIEEPTLCNIFCNVHTGEVEFYDWPDTNRWLNSARLLNMFYYMYKVGRLPELGYNTGMISQTLEEWSHEES